MKLKLLKPKIILLFIEESSGFSYLDKAFKIGGDVGQAGATAALNYGVKKFAPDLAGKAAGEIPKFLR